MPPSSSPEIVPLHKAAEEIAKELATEGIINPEETGNVGNKVTEIILKIQHKSAILHGFYVSPFAPHDHQEKYEELYPGVTKRQMDVFDERMKTRNWCDKVRVICVPIGMIFAFVIVLYGMFSGIGLIREGKTIDALTSMFAPLGGLAMMFILTKRANKSNKEDDWD